MGAKERLAHYVVEYDPQGRWLVATDRLGPDEFGASSIIARDVDSLFGPYLVIESEARAQVLDQLQERVDCVEVAMNYEAATMLDLEHKRGLREAFAAVDRLIKEAGEQHG